jgi:hypothetical protein
VSLEIFDKEASLLWQVPGSKQRRSTSATNRRLSTAPLADIIEDWPTLKPVSVPEKKVLCAHCGELKIILKIKHK